MEYSSPTPSSPPAREIHAARALSPSPSRSSRPPPSSTQEVPILEEIRRPPIPQSRREMELCTIRKIVASLEPGLSADELGKLERAAEAAGNVAGISPKTEFIAQLENGLFHKVLEAYFDLEK